jgi:hypothetical protein
MACRFNGTGQLEHWKEQGMANMAPNVALPLVRCAMPLVKVKTTLNPVAPSMKSNKE